MLRNYLYKITICFLLYGCGGSPELIDPDLKSTIEVPVDIQKNKEYGLRDLITDVEIIPLETSDESLLLSARKVVMEDYIYYLNHPKNVSIFDRSGKFIKTLENGEGPWELSQAMDFQVTEDGMLHVMEYKTIKHYSADGEYSDQTKFINERVTYLNPKSFCWFGEDNFFFWIKGTNEFSVEDRTDYYHLHHYKDGDMNPAMFKSFSWTFGENKFLRSSGKYYVTPTDYENEVVEINREGVVGKHLIDFGRYNVNLDKLRPGFHKEIGLDNFKRLYEFSHSIMNFMEIDNYFFFQFVHGSKWQFVFYDHLKKEFYSTPHDKAVIDGILPFRVIGLDRKDNKLLAVMEPQMWFDHIKNNDVDLKETDLLDSNIIDILSEVEDIDNPYLIKIGLKN